MDLAQIKLELKTRIAKGLNFGIEGFEEVVDASSKLYNDFILLKSKYNDLMHLSSMNTLAYDQIELGLDRLRNSLLGLIDHLEESHLEKHEVKSDLTSQALPTRRANFFQLLDIHFHNLEAVKYSEVDDFQTNGREAIYKLYQMYKYYFDKETKTNEIATETFFRTHFGRDSGALEVYFKNIGHIIAYAMESEVEQAFFLNIIKSLFSKYELGMIFYYAVSDIDPVFRALIKKSKLIDEAIAVILFDAAHLKHL
ncbi:MAG: putative phage abortive infection protein [Saprospiraceae bacterium]|nr:putative phage abortive infection protein [Saprospiraceae bacterium]